MSRDQRIDQSATSYSVCKFKTSVHGAIFLMTSHVRWALWTLMNWPDGKMRNTPLWHCVDGHVVLKTPDDKYFLWHEKSETTSIFLFVFVSTHLFSESTYLIHYNYCIYLHRSESTKQMEEKMNFQVPAEGLELVILLHTQY